MSMYIVSDESYQDFAQMLIANASEHAVYWTLKLEPNVASAENVEPVRNFVNKVITLNHLAAFGRYGDTVDSKAITRITELTPATHPMSNTHELYKLVSEIAYQCGEEWACETETYKTLMELKWRLADNIAQGVVYE